MIWEKNMVMVSQGEWDESTADSAFHQATGSKFPPRARRCV